MEQSTQALVGLRTALGVGVWIAPRLTGRLFGLDPKGNPQLPYIGRLFGARDVAHRHEQRAFASAVVTRWARLRPR